jgi:hypothetical protein
VIRDDGNDRGLQFLWSNVLDFSQGTVGQVSPISNWEFGLTFCIEKVASSYGRAEIDYGIEQKFERSSKPHNRYRFLLVEKRQHLFAFVNASRVSGVLRLCSVGPLCADLSFHCANTPFHS